MSTENEAWMCHLSTSPPPPHWVQLLLRHVEFFSTIYFSNFFPHPTPPGALRSTARTVRLGNCAPQPTQSPGRHA